MIIYKFGEYPTQLSLKITTLKIRNLICIVLQLFLLNNSVEAQTPSDALMMEKNELCLAVIYQQDTWDEYWEGTLLRKNANIGILTRNTYLPMMAYGVTDKLNVFVSLPYVSTEASAGQMVGVLGIQDFGIHAKYQILTIDKLSHAFKIFVAGGYSLPASSYLSDYMPFSLGLGTNEFSLRGVLYYEYQSTIYLRASYAYLHRTTTEAERDYYYADGSYYTTTMDVPSASNAEIALGGWLFKKDIQLEISLIQQNSFSGDDIRVQNAPQPTNKMDLTMVNARLRYYLPFAKNFSILGGYSEVLSGRNVGKSTIMSGGITYQFKVKKQKAQQN